MIHEDIVHSIKELGNSDKGSYDGWYQRHRFAEYALTQYYHFLKDIRDDEQLGYVEDAKFADFLLTPELSINVESTKEGSSSTLLWDKLTKSLAAFTTTTATTTYSKKL